MMPMPIRATRLIAALTLAALLFAPGCASNSGDVHPAGESLSLSSQRTRAYTRGRLRSPRGLRSVRGPRMMHYAGRRTRSPRSQGSQGNPLGSTPSQVVYNTIDVGTSLSKTAVDQLRIGYRQGGRVVYVGSPAWSAGLYGTQPYSPAPPSYNPATGIWTYH